MSIVGELWAEGRRLYVRSGANFHPCSIHKIPKGAHEYDGMVVRLNPDGKVAVVEEHRPEPMQRRLRGLRPSEGIKVGKVTAYRTREGGMIDHNIPFPCSAVRAFGEGEVQEGEIVEYAFDANCLVCLVTGPFGTHVSAVGRRLR